MEYTLSELAPGDAYRLLTRLVVPRPIAWVTSVNDEGIVNAAPFSFFNLLGSNPLVVGIGVGDTREGHPKDTARNSIKRGEFVVNLVDEETAVAMNITAIEFPHGVSELTEASLHAAPSVRIATPRIAEAPVHLECQLAETVIIGANRILLGEVVHVGLREGETPESLRLIARMGGGGGYVKTTDRFEMARITLRQWQERENA